MKEAFAILAVASLALAGVPQARAYRTIDLDMPGNLEAVQRSNPGHYAKIEHILSEVARHPPSERAVAIWMRTEFQARNVHYTDLVMTSLPPKKRLEFSLDDTRYVKVVRLTGWQAKPMPAKKVPLKEESAKEEAATREPLEEEPAKETRGR